MNEEKIFEMLGTLNERTKLILDQTTRTNGRVSKLETRVDELESKSDTAAGVKQVKKTFFDRCYSLGEKVFIILAGILIGRLFK